MFHMMNEARIAVGIGAAALGYAGFEKSLAYAKERRQGRPVGPEGKDPNQRAVRIIEHPDVRRMLLAQKAYAEGALALTLYCARLVDETRTGSEAQAREASALLELITPVAKSWPSEWGLEANSLAIQVLGGYGYTRDFAVEQLWRDNRLNMIHEGTHGIQALDLLGRKVRMDNGEAFELLARRVARTVTASAQVTALESYGRQLDSAFAELKRASLAAWQTGDPQDALANATPFLQAFGHVTVAWLWLDIGIAVLRGGARPVNEEGGPRQGKLQTLRYFFEYELPKVDAWLRVVANRNPTCRNMREDWFEQ
jgi:hypothetical protein